MQIRKLFFTTLSVLLPGLALCQKKEQSILNGRFYLTFPDSAKNIAIGRDIMSADPNANNETRIVYDIGDKRIVFYAEELFTKTAERLESKLRAESTIEFPILVRKFYDRDSVQCFSVTPVKPEENPTAIYTNSIIVKNADSSLSRLTVYLNKKAFADRKKFDDITMDVFNSFRKGERQLNLSAHKEIFRLSEKIKMEIILPKDYVVSIDQGPDFEVYNISKVTAYGDPQSADLTIYSGNHPSFFNTQFELANFKQAETESPFNSQKVKWLNFKHGERKIYLREQLIENPQLGKDALLHIAMISNEEWLLKELNDIVSDIRIVEDK